MFTIGKGCVLTTSYGKVCLPEVQTMQCILHARVRRHDNDMGSKMPCLQLQGIADCPLKAPGPTP